MVKVLFDLQCQYWKKLHGISTYAIAVLSGERIVAHGPLGISLNAFLFFKSFDNIFF